MRLKFILLATAFSMAFTLTLPAQINGTGSLVTNTNSGSATFTYTLANPGSSNVLVAGVYNDNTVTSPVITFNGNPAVKSITENRTSTACYFLPTPAPASVSITYTIAGTNATNTGLFVYELGGIDTSGGSASVDSATGSSITTTGDAKFVVDFSGINFGTGAGTVPAAGSIIPSANAGVFNINGGVGGGALAHGYGYAGLAGTQMLGWNHTNTAQGEVSLAFVSAENPDSDSDGILDVWELSWDPITDLTQLDGTIGSPVGSGDGSGDWDGDSHTDLEEFNANSDPTNAASIPGDIDADGWSDADELAAFGNLGHEPNDDFDGDHSTNIEEVTSGTSPSNANSWPDIEPDGMADGWEAANGLNVGIDDSGDHADADGFTNIEEFEAGTDPQDAAWFPGNATLAHRWSFNGDLTDSVGGSNAQILNDDEPNAGFSSFQSATAIELWGGSKAFSDYVLLGNNLLSNLQSDGVQPVTIELWATQNSIMNWSRIFNFGTDDGSNPGPNESLRMVWSQGVNVNADQVIWEGMFTSWAPDNAPYVLGVPFHIVMTIVPAVYSNGAIASGAQVTWYSAPSAGSQSGGHPLFVARNSVNSASDLRALLDSACTLGRSYYGDNTAAATYDEVRIWKGALGETERELFQLLGPDNIDRSDVDNGGLGDGFPDQWEIARFGDTTTATAGVDSDGDGIDDDVEFDEQSHPNDIDSTVTDSDKDTLTDTWEMQYFNNLLQNGTDDPDNDFIDNDEEHTAGTDPTDPDSSPDSDGDGIADGWEMIWFGDLTSADSTLRAGGSDTNADGDLDTDLEEYLGGFDPSDEYSGRDTDNDQLPDYWEYVYFQPILGGSYLAFNATNDYDGDDATHAEEFADLTSPTDSNDFRDANGDNIFDGFVLAAGDGFGQTSFNAGTNWTGALAPVANKNYLVPSGLRLRTPNQAAANVTFAGKTLAFAGELGLKGDGGTFNANYVFADVSTTPGIISIVDAHGTATLGGTVNFLTDSVVTAQNGPIAFSALVSGSGALNLIGPYAVQFNNASNTYSGDITMGSTASLVVNGMLNTGTGSVFNVAPGAAGVSNSISGTGTLGLAGTLNIELDGVAPSTGASWGLVAAITVNYDSGFTVTGSGFTPDGGAVGERIWTDTSGDYEFDELTGVLSFVGIIEGYAGWASDWLLTEGVNAGATDNPDVDNFDNILEYQLGGDPLAFEKDLVQTSEDGTYLIFTFERYDLSESDSTLNFQWGTNLGIWNDVVIGDFGATDGNGVEVIVGEDLGAFGTDYDAITVKVPKSLAPSGKLFGRLQGTQP